MKRKILKFLRALFGVYSPSLGRDLRLSDLRGSSKEEWEIDWDKVKELVENPYPALDTRVKYLRDIQPIEQIKKGDWTDLRAGKDILLFKGQYVEIPLGVAIELPKGYEALMAARSSTFKKYGVIMVNGIAIMDESYCGDNDEWHFLAYATKDTFIRKNERICQFRVIEHQPELNLIPANKLGNADRGGIGSTGVI